MPHFGAISSSEARACERYEVVQRVVELDCVDQGLPLTGLLCDLQAPMPSAQGVVQAGELRASADADVG